MTHPFHRFRGQRFRILKSRKWAGQLTLILEGGEGGTFAVAREWTDRDPSSGGRESGPAGRGAVLEQRRLLELVALVDALKSARKKD